MPFDDPAILGSFISGGFGDPGAGDVTPPAAPTGLVATPGHLQVGLDWDDNIEDDFNHYRVYRATVSGGPYALIATLQASELNATGLSNGTTYYFVVTAVDDANNESATTSEVSATPAAGGGDITPPAAPTGLSPTAGDAQVVLDWNDNGEGDLDHYLVYRATVTGGPYTVIASATASAHTATGLANGTTYFFVVTALDTTGNESAASTEVSSTPTGAADTTAPATPTGLSAVGETGQIRLDWNDNTEPDLANYRVYRSTSSGGTYTLISTPVASANVDNTTPAGTTFFYKVSAMDTSGNESALSSVVSAAANATGPGPVGIVIPAGASIQSYVNANLAGTAFVLAAGTWNNQTVTPKPGNSFIGTLGSSGQRLSILDGGGTTQFSIYVGSGSVARVTIKNIIVTNYNPPVQRAAVGGYGMIDGLIENVESHHNATGGMSFGSGMTIRNCYIHHNKQTGIYANGAANAIVQNNEISFNNYLQLYDPMWEAGGSKFLYTRYLILRGNYVHDNHGPGLWTDVNNIYSLYDSNRAINNFGPGLFHEISFDCEMLNNYVEGNGFGYPAWLDGCGILVNSSQNVEIHNNTVVRNNDGIGSTFTQRGTGLYGAFETRNLNVHDNTIVQPTGRAAGIVTSVVGSGVFTTFNNHFENNDYDVPNPSTSTMWEWNGASRNWAAWQSFGHDDTGSVS